MEGAALVALRDATDEASRALERLPLAQRVMSREVTLDDYRAWLQAHLAVFVAWTESYPQALRRYSRCDPALRLDALHLDLAVLHEGVIDDMSPGDYRFDWPADSPAWWGALYVIEGTRQDARGVASHLRQQLGLCVSGALRFLDPVNEAASQPAWSNTVQCLERVLTADKLAEGIDGARATLDYFAQALGGRAMH